MLRGDRDGETYATWRCVFVSRKGAVVRPDHQIEISVPVKIDKAGGAVGAHIEAVERIGRPRQRAKPASAVVRKTAQRAIVRTHHQIEIAVPVKIDKAGGAFGAHIEAIERIVCTRQRGKPARTIVRKTE